jgi:hypothetical protein
MAIVDGQRVRALESNAAWVSKTADSTVVGKITLNRAGSGAIINDTQQDINTLKTDVGSLQTGLSDAQADIATLQALDTFIYAGNWDASSNTPTLADGDGGATFGIGATFRVSVAGTQDLGSGNITFAIGDKVVYNVNAVWEKWDSNDADIDLNDLADVDTTGVQARDYLRRNVADTAWEEFNLDSVGNDTTSGTGVALAAVSNSIVRLTNAALVSFNNIPAGFSGQKVIVVNRTTVDVSIINDAGGTAANRILTGTGADITLSIDAALTFEYDATTTRWQIVGGSGGSAFTGYQEIPTGTINGSNATFGPLTYVPTSDESINVYVDGVLLRFDQWTKSGLNIVLDVAPVLGQEVYVTYITEGGVALPSISGIWKVEYRTISAPEATAEQLTLAHSPAVPGEVLASIRGGGAMFYTDDFTVTGTTFDWSVTPGYFSAGDKIIISYVY